MDIDVWQESEFTFSQPTGIRLNWKRGDHTDFSDIIKIKFYVKGIVELTSKSNGVYTYFTGLIKNCEKKMFEMINGKVETMYIPACSYYFEWHYGYLNIWETLFNGNIF